MHHLAARQVVGERRGREVREGVAIHYPNLLSACHQQGESDVGQRIAGEHADIEELHRRCSKYIQAALTGIYTACARLPAVLLTADPGRARAL